MSFGAPWGDEPFAAVLATLGAGLDMSSLSTSDQLSVDSLYPGTVLTTTLLPSLRAAITTSTATFSFSRPALT